MALDASAEIIVYGNPSLDEILQFVVGAESFKSGINHQVWFNEIYVAGSKILNGDAGKVAGGVQCGQG
ncbi:MAG: hypothetical protein LBN19_00120 [Endomicrobium sp.]|nr:hypothetical protein [Endomicrobium sp.]